jgi:hypothetical protein
MARDKEGALAEFAVDSQYTIIEVMVVELPQYYCV